MTTKEDLKQQEETRKKNHEAWLKELEFWKKENPHIFRKVRYDNDLVKMTYAEFKSLIKEGDL